MIDSYYRYSYEKIGSAQLLLIFILLLRAWFMIFKLVTKFINVRPFHSSKMVTAKKFVLSKHFKGEPKVSDLTLVEEELPPVGDGGI